MQWDIVNVLVFVVNVNCVVRIFVQPMLWLRLCEDCKFIPWFIIDAVRLCACSQGFESKPCREICEAYGLCHVSNYLGRIPKSRYCTNYKVVVYRIGQTSPVSHFLPPPPPSPLHSPIPCSLVPPFLFSPFSVPGFKDSRFQSISRFSTEKTIFLPVFNLQTLKTSLPLVFYSYSTRMYSYVLVFYSYVLVCYSYVLVCYSYVLVCYSYVLVWCFSHDRSHARFRPEPQFFRVPVPARTNKKSIARTGTLLFSVR